MGEMFYRKQPMSEIMAATYDTLRYFDGWSQAERRGEMEAKKKALLKKGQ